MNLTTEITKIIKNQVPLEESDIDISNTKNSVDKKRYYIDLLNKCGFKSQAKSLTVTQLGFPLITKEQLIDLSSEIYRESGKGEKLVFEEVNLFFPKSKDQIIPLKTLEYFKKVKSFKLFDKFLVGYIGVGKKSSKKDPILVGVFKNDFEGSNDSNFWDVYIEYSKYHLIAIWGNDISLDSLKQLR